MKKTLLFLPVIVVSHSFAQDTSEVAEPRTRNIHHEIGANTTLLLKQVFNLSGTTFTTLPYNITYKFIWRDFAFRTGFGFSRSESTTEETESIVSTSVANTVIPGPEKMVPTVNEFFSYSLRTGLEYRKKFDRVAAYAGLDFIMDKSESHFQSSSENNNLPNSYFYTKTTNDVSSASIGAGPVAGFQVFISKRLALFTEMPFYFTMTKQKDVSENYFKSGQLDFMTGEMVYNTTTSKNTEETSQTSYKIILPVTLYLSFWF